MAVSFIRLVAGFVRTDLILDLILVYNEKTCREGRFNFVRRKGVRMKHFIKKYWTVGKLSILLYSIKEYRNDGKSRLYTLNAVWYSSIIFGLRSKKIRKKIKYMNTVQYKQCKNVLPIENQSLQTFIFT